MVPKKLRQLATDQRNLANRLAALAKRIDGASPDAYTRSVLEQCRDDAKRIADRLAAQTEQGFTPSPKDDAATSKGLVGEPA